MAGTELARFLRSRREGLRPDVVGLPGGPGRRTPGLRREEVADLACMSVDYYVRLEQARGPRPSPRILESLAGALRLGPAESAHLFRLAGVLPRPPAGPPRTVRPYVAALLNRIPGTAAIVTAASYDVIGHNPLAEALLGDLGERPNLARRRFMFREQVLTTGHEDFAELAVSRLRAAADRYPQDPELTALVRELRAGSEEFNAVWAANPVRVPGHRTKTMLHPELGPLRINCDVLMVPEDDQQVVFMTADPDTAEARALTHLAEAVAAAV
ncbi:MAG: helix-turn-helix transcriptional regulator [Actinocrinis sp.]